MRVVFDTSIFVSAFATNSSQAARAIDRVITGRDRLFISRPILFELSRVLATKFARDPEQLARIAVFLADISELVVPRTRISRLSDLPDNRILECAVAAKADAIVTGDRAMLALEEFQDIPILTLAQYMTASGRR